MIFQNRKTAGRKLAKRLEDYRSKEGFVVVGIPRGGVVVAAEISKILDHDLNVVVVEKLSAPENNDLGIGAVTPIGAEVYNHHLISLLGLSKEYLKKESLRKRERAHQELEFYTACNAPLDVKGKSVILVDEGVATGATIRSAIQVLRKGQVEKIILTVPVGASSTLKNLQSEVEELHCLFSPAHFEKVGAFYKDFGRVENDEVIDLLKWSTLNTR